MLIVGKRQGLLLNGIFVFASGFFYIIFRSTANKVLTTLGEMFVPLTNLFVESMISVTKSQPGLGFINANNPNLIQ